MKEDWISVKDELPLEEYREKCLNVIGDFLVTVELDSHEPCDDRGVIILTYYLKEGVWKIPLGKEYNWGWHVTHWMEKPKPAN